ncbi:tRNA-uridine 2-sulfurtransferase [Fistulifera solaris]|uniref:tRNA-5-taurinomethyluridine 2-sulfurtransferase n=1 Tax=Fistulifera solaris TaxID=1519565 RepID=A0A1Z5KTB7_FISSO|nr:tRNA-uridine 2-sulfurtransferase [Fistulifera solaris]|eukprot:GAX29580.1 tRNA-uridine 2-sulfurtransferase [Fistulifera solaris]
MSLEDISKDLVQHGYQWKKKQQQQPENESQEIFTTTTSLVKVPGCTANVHIQLVLTSDSSTTRNSRTIQSLQGTADALVSQGLVAVIASCVEQQSEDTIGQISAESITARLGLQQHLSPGRNDGVASLWRILHQSLQSSFPASSTTSAKTIKYSQQPSVALLLSGGVDSSVALRLLLQQNYRVTAFYLKIWLQDENAHLGGTCPWEEDWKICQQVCEQADVPLRAISLQQEYHERVVEYAMEQASLGRTPNPDILCNSRIKFGCFYDVLMSQQSEQFDYIATGHYARVERDDNGVSVCLFRAPDAIKDQSYFLCTLTQEQLQKTLFPLGHLEKTQVRQLADEFELPNRHRPDSQGLCFLGQVKFDQFLKSYLGTQPGSVVDAVTGDVIGQHQGVWFHTIGQRKGIGKALNPQATARGPWYVVSKDPVKRIVYCTNQYELFDAQRKRVELEDVTWMSGQVPAMVSDGNACRLTMKLRHGPRLARGLLQLNDAEPSKGTVELEQMDSGLAPGQYVVFYADDGECLGSGIMSESQWNRPICLETQAVEQLTS